jgi:hypothetical protein
LLLAEQVAFWKMVAAFSAAAIGPGLLFLFEDGAVEVVQDMPVSPRSA